MGKDGKKRSVTGEQQQKRKLLGIPSVTYLESLKGTESRPVVRRLSTPYHGLPSVVDYDPKTGFVTFGQLIEPPKPVVHPRRYVPPAMPLMNKYPGICRHNYCLNERRRLYGLAVPEEPIGLPWATGLLNRLPGHVEIQFPLRRRKRKRRQKKKEDEPEEGKEKKKEEDGSKVERMCKMAGAVDEMLHFYKIILLAGTILNDVTKEYCEEEVTKNENGDPGKLNAAQNQQKKTQTPTSSKGKKEEEKQTDQIGEEVKGKPETPTIGASENVDASEELSEEPVAADLAENSEEPVAADSAEHPEEPVAIDSAEPSEEPLAADSVEHSEEPLAAGSAENAVDAQEEPTKDAPDEPKREPEAVY